MVGIRVCARVHSLVYVKLIVTGAGGPAAIFTATNIICTCRGACISNPAPI